MAEKTLVSNTRYKISMKLVIFDFDGTLIDTRRDIITAVNYARKQFELPVLADDAVTGMVGDGISMLTHRAFAGTAVDLSEAEKAILDYYLAHPADHARLYPGVETTLPTIEGTRTIVSNKLVSLVKLLLDHTGLTPFFEFIAGGDTFEERKPDPMAVKFLLSRYSVSSDEAIMVGDHAPDIEMAKRAGIRSVYCNYGFFGRDTVGADFNIDSFEELLDILDQNVFDR